MVSAVVVRGFDGHRERFMITGICYGFAPVVPPGVSVYCW